MAEGSKAAAKAAGKLKGAAKAMSGYPGIFHHLAGEHAEVATAMKRISGSKEDSSAREEVFAEMRKNLLAHAKGEEQEFYPRFEQRPELEGLVRQCLEEHQRIESLLQTLNTGDKSTAAWSRQFEELKHVVEAHVDREENELFPRAKDAISSDEAREMQDRFERVEEQEKTRH